VAHDAPERGEIGRIVGNFDLFIGRDAARSPTR
jgi:hypothetical protein